MNSIQQLLRTGKRPASMSPARERRLMWWLFIGAHAFYTVLSAMHGHMPYGDVTVVYREWITDALAGNARGITEPFVYPVAALIPMWIAHLLGGEAFFVLGWMAQVLALNSLALWWLTTRRGRFTELYRRAGWWWTVFLWLLGPIAFGRIDAITVPIALVALLRLRRGVFTSSFWLTIGAWIKVWPAALVAAVFTTCNRRLRVVAGGIAACAVVLIPVLFVAGRSGIINAFSFVAGQHERGLQLESVFASVFLLGKSIGIPGYEVEYSREILTQEVFGPGVDAVGALLTPLMFALLVMLLILAVRRVHSGARIAQTLPVLALGIVLSFIIANKVGSPQFISWLAPIIVLGLVWWGRGMGRIARLGLIVAALTQFIYPWGYGYVVRAELIGVLMLAARNALLVWMLVIVVRELLRPPARVPLAVD